MLRLAACRAASRPFHQLLVAHIAARAVSILFNPAPFPWTDEAWAPGGVFVPEVRGGALSVEERRSVRELRVWVEKIRVRLEGPDPVRLDKVREVASRIDENAHALGVIKAVAEEPGCLLDYLLWNGKVGWCGVLHANGAGRGNPTTDCMHGCLPMSRDIVYVPSPQ